MENLTNLGSIYTNNFDQQEDTFRVSDMVVLISKAEEKYYKKYNYDKINPNTYVIYNSYSPKYDNVILNIDYLSINKTSCLSIMIDCREILLKFVHVLSATGYQNVKFQIGLRFNVLP